METVKEYTDEEKEVIGDKIAEIFLLKRGDMGRWRTGYWGSKSGIGIFHMIQELNERINKGEPIE